MLYNKKSVYLQNNHDLKKVLGTWDSMAIIIAIVIGIGIFRVPAEVARHLGSPFWIAFAWLLGGIISLLGGLCYAELASSFPKTGGNYVYLNESYGPWASFLFGWVELLAIRTGSIAAMAFIFAEYLESLLSVGAVFIKPLAALSVIMLSLVNIIGLRWGARVQSIFTLTKIAALAGIIIVGVLSNKGSLSHFQAGTSIPTKNILPLLGLVLIPILWTYGGWHENTFLSGETKNPRRTIPLALFIGISIITVLYLAVNILFIYLIPVDKIAGSALIASDALKIIYGKTGQKILEAIIIISALASINAMIVVGGRITYVLSKDNMIFRYIGRVTPKYNTPHRAITINAVLSIILIIWGTFNKLLFFTGILVWLFFALVASSLFILRKKFPNIKRPYKVWGYPTIPSIFIIACIALIINTFIHYTFQSVVGLFILLSGIPVYMLSKNMEERKLKSELQ